MYGINLHLMVRLEFWNFILITPRSTQKNGPGDIYESKRSV